MAMNSDLAAQQALDRLAKAGFDGLSPADRIAASVWTFEAGVANRGFRLYFTSAAGDMAHYVPTALKTIGAVERAEIASRANAIFGVGSQPLERARRRERAGSLSEEAREELRNLEIRFYDSREDVDELLETYLNKTHV